MDEASERFMRSSDAFSWYLEQDPGLRSTIVAVAFLASRPDFEVLAARLERATRLIPRFRQVPVEPPARLATPRWADVDFDLSLHLRRVNAPAPQTAEAVVDLARVEAMTAFDRSRPLWQFTLVEGLADGGAAFIMKVHHALTDGIGGMQLAFLLFEATAVPATGDEQPEPPESRPAPNAVTLVREALVHDAERLGAAARLGLGQAVPTARAALGHPIRTVSHLAGTAASLGRFVQPVSDTLSQVMTERGLGRELGLLAVDLDDLKRAARAADGSVNDAFVASVTGGLRRYHEFHEAPVAELRVTLPISMRTEHDAAGGNRITLQRFKVPVGVRDAATRLRLTTMRCRAARDELALPFSNAVAATLNLLPSGVVASMLKHIDFVASNVPGSTFPIYLARAEVTGYYAFGPTSGASVNVTLLSYNGSCCIGCTIDSAAVPDSDVLLAFLAEGFEEVLALGGDHRPVTSPIGAPPSS